MEPQTAPETVNPPYITLTAEDISLADFIRLVHENAKLHGWWDDDERNSGEQIALIHSELSEALEGMRQGDPPDQHCPEFGSVVIELADVIIRVCDLCMGAQTEPVHGTMLGQALIAKHNYNCTRPYKHGGKKF